MQKCGTAEQTPTILDSIGHTPLVEIRRLNPVKGVKIYAKLEYMNPGGSIKDRAALSMILEGERTGELTSDKTVIEATSGNTGIGLAMICSVKGYNLVLAMSESASGERKSILRARGARILLTPAHLGSDGAIEEVYRLCRENVGKYFMTDQYNNEANWKAHYHTTGVEIYNQTGGKVNSVVSTLGTTGTAMGISRRMKEYGKHIRVIGAEPFLGHGVQGLKNMKESYTPEIFDKNLLDEKLNIEDEEAFEAARNLAKAEGLFVGMSSGAAMAAAVKEARKIKSGVVVAIFPDSGERYLSTPLFAVKKKLNLNLFNTMTKKKERFEPVSTDAVSVYTCGPTVNKRLDVSGFRRFVFTDLLLRYIEYRGFSVNHVVNITDLDDKTIEGSARADESLETFTDRHVDAFKKDLATLNVRPAQAYPRVSENVDEMVRLARTLQNGKFAYEKLHSLYFDISSLPEYGHLSGIDLDKIRIGATVDLDEYEKDNPRDFTLLKRVSLSELKRGIGVRTEWGNVRPSLHLQCAAISMKYLGQRFDLHTGSRELVFPHHENETAICRAKTGGPLAGFWAHCEPVNYDGSLGVDSVKEITLDTLFDMGWDRETVRFWMLSAHYRKRLVLCEKALAESRSALDRVNRVLEKLENVRDRARPAAEKSVPPDQFIYDMKQGFISAMDDDAKVSGVISMLFKSVKYINRLVDRGEVDAEGASMIIEFFRELDTVLQVFRFDFQKSYSRKVRELMEKRKRARLEKNWELADRLRKELLEMGVTVQDESV
ncbi:MAG: cysteine synthase [Desulfarculaceae bacterium]|nr:cysteine synthase [Desulfarculaceae bacterium]